VTLGYDAPLFGRMASGVTTDGEVSMAKQHQLVAYIPATDYRAMQQIAKREDRSVASIVRAGIQRILIEKGAAPTVVEDGPKDARAGAIHGSA
jgi:hypothetical protein